MGHRPSKEESVKVPVLKRGLFKTPQGWVAAAWTTKGLSALVLPYKTQEQAFRQLSNHLPPLPRKFWDSPMAKVDARTQKEVKKALAGKRYTSVKTDLFFLTPFQSRVLEATSSIPWGEVRTYGWVARQAGSPRGFRAAGQALNRNPVFLLIPCHRVIASGNRLGGYGGELDWKIRLLKAEKVRLLSRSDGSYKVSML